MSLPESQRLRERLRGYFILEAGRNGTLDTASRNEAVAWLLGWHRALILADAPVTTTRQAICGLLGSNSSLRTLTAKRMRWLRDAVVDIDAACDWIDETFLAAGLDWAVDQLG